MKLLFGAAVAALLMATPAMAQTEPPPAASCGTLAPMPGDQPDGATSSAANRSRRWTSCISAACACRARQEGDWVKALTMDLPVEIRGDIVPERRAGVRVARLL